MTSFVFFESFFLMFQELDETLRLKMFEYTCNYGLYHQEPENLQGVEKALWIPIKTSIDAMSKKRGRPAKAKDKAVASLAAQAIADDVLPKEPKEQPEKAKEPTSSDDVQTKNSPVTVPTEAEVYDYCARNKLQINPKQFFDYYTHLGWKTKQGQPIVNWQALCHMWGKNTFTGKNSSQQEADYKIAQEKYADELQKQMYRIELEEPDLSPEMVKVKAVSYLKLKYGLGG